ncbi:hypothetical protein EfmAA290_28140 [Enterococcus faecium]|nr:hypothetical protein EfmAA290_28140 [Enterococcus faecium]
MGRRRTSKEAYKISYYADIKPAFFEFFCKVDVLNLSHPVTDVTPGGTIDTNTPGNYEGVIEVTYPDGTKDTVKVPVEVTDNRSDADKYEPTVEGEKVEVGGTVDLTDNVTNLPTLPEGTTVTDVTCSK